MSSRAVAVFALALCACGTSNGSAPSASAEAVRSSSPPPPASATDALPPGDPCGGITCRQFDSPDDAFAAIVDEAPRILAIGETHAQKGSERIPSVTSRFTASMLPQLKGKASALVLELWVNDGSCGKAKEKAVEKQQKEIVKDQAKTDQNEFVTLAKRAKEIGVVPSIVHPTCDELDKIQKAGDDGVFEMLTMLTNHMRDEATAVYNANAKTTPNEMILTYGGAMHNDPAPKKEREQWSFAKALDDLSGHKYIALDLVVPEFVGQNESWKSMPWYAAFQRAANCDEKNRGRTKTVVFTTSPRAYTLVFPCTR